MKISNLLFFSLFIFNEIFQIGCIFDPISVIALGSVAAGLVSFLYKNPDTKETTMKYANRFINRACQMIGYCEGCKDYWIPANLQGLEYELKSEVFGQPLAVEIILSALKNHLKNTNPRRSLVLSFQGSPGTGKNFISKKILKNMFLKGNDTKYVKFFRSSIDFPSNERSRVDKYKTGLVETIRESVYECHRSVFVFDEVEKMPSGILDVLSYFVRTGKEGDYDYRRVIFILLSNVGEKELNQEAYEAWKRGINREDISTSKLTRILHTASYNGEGGLQRTGLVKNHDVSYYVPFLPLERHHILQCLEHYVVVVKKQIMKPKLTEQVLEEMIFQPEKEKVFSTSGCKRVAEVADMLIERETRRKRKEQRSRSSY